MAQDFKKKEPTKSERMIFELAMHQENIERNVYANTNTTLAMALLLGVDAQKIAQLLTTDNQKVKDYAKVINEAIDKLEKERKDKDKDNNSNSAE